MYVHREWACSLFKESSPRNRFQTGVNSMTQTCAGMTPKGEQSVRFAHLTGSRVVFKNTRVGGTPLDAQCRVHWHTQCTCDGTEEWLNAKHKCDDAA